MTRSERFTRTRSVSLGLIVSFLGSGLTVGAQVSTRAADPRAQSPARANGEWSRVRKLASGTEIIVTVKGSSSTERYFVAADERDLTALNVSDPALPTAARDILRRVAATHPEYFPAARKGGQFVLEKNVRVGSDGVFVADRKVADLEQIVQEIPRTNVAEITAASKSGVERFRKSQHFGVGAFLGACVGAATGIVVGTVSTHKNPDSLLPLFAPIVGGLMGSMIGSIADSKRWAASHTADDVIYRAP